MIQVPLQPSPGRLLPSSHGSGGSRLISPSPQAGPEGMSSQSSGASSASQGLGGPPLEMLPVMTLPVMALLGPAEGLPPDPSVLLPLLSAGISSRPAGELEQAIAPRLASKAKHPRTDVCIETTRSRSSR